MKLYRKLFAKKHDDKWYQGEETELQKINRKNAVIGVPVLSAASGGLLGANIALKHAGNKADEKYMKAAARHIDRLKKVNEAINVTSNKVKPQDRQKYLDLLKKVEKRLLNSEKALEGFEKRSGKIVNKAALKGGLKGVAVGTAVGGGLGYLLNKAVKKSNMEGNKARRNKYKKKDN